MITVSTVTTVRKNALKHIESKMETEKETIGGVPSDVDEIDIDSDIFITQF